MIEPMPDLNEQLVAAAKVAYENGFKKAFQVCKRVRGQRLKNAPLSR